MRPRADDAEYQRLQTLAGELDGDSQRWLAGLHPRDDWRCLEIGAGTGSIARWLARQCPEGSVIATDVDLRFLQNVPEPNLEVRYHDVTVDTFPDASFDLIHARWLFFHLRDRERALERAASWLKPGGWLMVEDPSGFAIDSSPHAGYRKMTNALADALQRRIGTDGHWPRLYPQPLLRLGLEAVDVAVSCSVIGAGRPMGRFTVDVVRIMSSAMIEAGQVTEAEIEEFAELMEREDFHDLGPATLAAWGRRPGR